MPFKGTHWSKMPNKKEILEKIRNKKIGKKQSKETIEKRRLKLLGKKRSLETLLKMSLSQKGKPKWTEEQKKQIGERQKGKKLSEEHKRKIGNAQRGSKGSAWKGDDVGYIGLHIWVNKRLGKPSKCDNCGKENLYGHKIHWANISKKYKRDIKDWIRLCVSCHWKFDKPYEKRLRDLNGRFISCQMKKSTHQK